MAGGAVSYVVARLTDILANEAKLLYGVQDSVEQLRSELIQISSFLKDADRKQSNERVRNWVTEIRDAAYDAEDVIEDFVFKVASYHQEGLSSTLRRYISIFTDWKHRQDVRNQIEAIRDRIKSISDIPPRRYGIKSLSEIGRKYRTTDIQQRLRRWYPYTEPEVVVAEKDIDDLVKILTKEDDEQRGMVSIVGMGGIGKSALTKKVFNCEAVGSHFDFRAWGFICQEFRTREVLLEILSQVATASDEELQAIKHNDEQELVLKLHKFLEEKRYLVVLDDVWHSEVWDSLKPAFPNGKGGSKVMLTTSNKEVSLHADPAGYIHNMKIFTKQQSWELLCSKAFPEYRTPMCRPGFEDIVVHLVEKCGGLPLALALLGGLLATKKTLHEWEIVSSNINKLFNEGVTGILALSYNDLPYNMKPCFIYLGVLPEYYEISARRLIQLWVAEGFIERETMIEGETMEEVGELILLELIDRCMVQVVRQSLTGGIRTCRIHDVMKDFCLQKAEEECFLKVLSGATVKNSTNIQKFRRRAIHSQEASSSAALSNPHLRTLLFFENVGISATSLRNLHKDFKLLRVLQLQCVKMLPNEMGKMSSLRYLGLRNSKIRELPPAMGGLTNLQSLEIRKNSVPVILYGSMILKLEKLRYINIDEFSVQGDLQMDSMRHLHTVSKITAGEWAKLPVENPTSLRKFKIVGLSVSQAEAVVNSLVEKSTFLLCLSLKLDDWYAKPRHDTPIISRCDLQPLSSCDCLQKLLFFGPIEVTRLPQNLIKIHLEWSLLEEDPMEMLQTLPNLRMVVLNENSYLGTKMVCSAGGFPRLENLKLIGLYALETWTIEKGALPHLKYLELKYCSQLKRIPEGLKFVTTLGGLAIRNMPPEFRDRVKQGGEDWDCVNHIRSIDE